MKKITLLLTLIFFQLITYSQINSSSFQASVQFPVGTKPEDVAVGDLDLDGKIDIVTCNSTTHNISVLRNQSTVGVINPASFASAVQFNLISGDTPYGIDVGDIDGDGKPEIVTANRYGDSISVFLNATTPGVINTSSFATKLNFHAPQYCRDIIVADFDGDGKNDVAAVGQFVFSVWRNTSTVGNISFATRYDLSHSGNLGMGITAGDLDGDGMKDIVIAATQSSSSSGYIRYYRNQSVPGGIAFAYNGYKGFDSWFQAHDVTLSDFNGDGKLDILTCAEKSSASSSSMWVATNVSTVGNINMVQYPTAMEIPGGTQYGGQGVGAADIDGDGSPEILNVRPVSGTNRLRVRRNIHDFVGDTLYPDDFEPYVQFTGGNGGGFLNYSRMRTADFDGDGKIDAVLTNDGSNSVSVFMNTSSTTNTITTSSTVVTSTCSGQNISVPFTCNAPFTGSNVFSAELSDATGSFTSPTVIGTLGSTVSGTINATIPGGTPAGNNYRIRVVSSDPIIVGTDNGIDITIGGTPVSVSIAISPSDSVCAGTSVTFTATPVNGGSSPSYQWRRNATNVGTNSPTYITTSYADNDVFTCIMTSNIGGCATGNPATSNPITMTVTPLPITPSVISGANSVCENSSNTYSVTNVSGVTYNWGLPTGWTGSSTTNSINTTAGTTGGNISISASNGCGTSSIRTLNVSVNPLPNIVVSGNTSICDGDATTLTATGASSYAWDNGAGTGASVSVSPTSTTTYTVTGTDANSCSNTAQVTVTVNPLPTVVYTQTPNIVCENDAPFALTGGSPSGGIYSGTGVNAGNFDPALAGAGTHTITYAFTDGNNCSDSDTQQIQVDVCAGIDEQANQLVTVYPNPFKNEFTVSFTTSGNHTIELLNVLGEQVKLINVYEQNTVINTDDLPSSVYFLRIVDEKLIFKLLKN